jgi:hypothetical protein
MAGPTFNATNATGNSFTSAASWTPLSITGVLTNDTILVFVINTTNANPTLIPTGVADGQGSYTLVATAQVAFDNSMTIWALTGATAGTHTVTITFASAVAGYVLWSTWSNSGGSFVDQGGGNFTSGVSTLSQTLVNAQTNDTVISAWNAGGAAAISQSGTLWFNGGGLGVGVQAQSQVQSGTGSINPSATFASGSTFGDFVAVSLQNNAAGNSLMGQICL